MKEDYRDFSREDLERMRRRLRRIFGPWLTPDLDGDDLLQEALVVIMERGLWKYGRLEKLISSVARNLARNVFSSARRRSGISLERLMTEHPQGEEV